MIRFRQRNKNNGHWHYWGLVNGGWRQPLVRDDYEIPEESEQYTGFKDVKGRRIYEGDVVRFIPEKDWHVLEGSNNTFYQDAGYYEVRLNGGHWDIHCDTYVRTEWLEEYHMDIVVVGNIHENPKLVGGLS